MIPEDNDAGLYEETRAEHGNLNYSPASLQDFEWEVSKDGSTIKMISTFDSGFSDASFSKRVASGDISVVRLQDNEAELKISELKSQDAGSYICHTPSTDSVISGNYKAEVQLTGKKAFFFPQSTQSKQPHITVLPPPCFTIMVVFSHT